MTGLPKLAAPLYAGFFSMPQIVGPVPPFFARPRFDTLLMEATTYFSNRQGVATDPFEDLHNDLRFVRKDVVPCVATRLFHRNISITIGRTAKHVDRTTLCRMTFAATTSFKNLGTFVF